MASIRGILNIQSLNELTSENRITQCQSLLTSSRSNRRSPIPCPIRTSPAKSLLSCTAHTTHTTVRLRQNTRATFGSHFRTIHAAAGPQTMVGRRDSAQAGNRT